MEGNIIMNGMIVIAMFVIAEILGAVIYYRTKDSVKRTLLTSLGLGFALAVIFADILPDALENYSAGLWVCLLGGAVILALGYFARRIGNYSGVAALGVHNLAEGVIISAFSAPMSVFVVLGAILHKLPEGMLSFSLLDGLKEKTRFAIASLIALLIPLGAILPLPEGLTKPLLAFACGVIAVVVSKFLIMTAAELYKKADATIPRLAPAQFAIAVLSGALIAWLSCLVV